MNPLEEAVMLTPWKTPSQYAAYVNSIKKTHAVNRARREKELVRRTRLTAKSQTDLHLAEIEEARRLEHLEKLEAQRRMVTHLVRAATPQPASSTRGGASCASAAQRRSASRAAESPSVPFVESLHSDVDVPQRGPKQSGELQKTRQPVENAPHLQRVCPANDRTKVEAKAGHYVFEDEVGLIDIDDGESSSSASSVSFADDDDDQIGPDERVPAALDGGHNSSTGASDGATSVDAPLLTDDALIALLQMADGEALEYLQAALTLPTDVAPGGHEEEGGAMDSTTPPTMRRRNLRRVASTPASVAMFLSSMRPHALTAIRRIEESRRIALHSTWWSERQEILGHFCRRVAANAAQESSTEKRLSMLIQQETALRALIAAKRSSAVDRLHTDEDISRRKIQRMERVRGRLNDKEDKAARDDARQKHLLDELAHKMLMRVMNDAKGDVDLMVDNTDAWAVNRKRNSSVTPQTADGRAKRLSTTAGGLLAGFYLNQTAEDKKRRRSIQVSEESARSQPPPASVPPGASELSGVLGKGTAQSSVSAVWDSASSGVMLPVASGGEPPYTASKLANRRASRKRSSAAGAPPSLSADSMNNHSIAISYGTPLFSATDDKRRISEEDARDEEDTTAPWTSVQKDRSKEERWRLEAKRISQKLKHELLHECQPDFSAAYDKRTSENDRPPSESGTSGGAPATPQLQLHDYSAFAPTPLSPALVPDQFGSHSPLDNEEKRNARGIAIISPTHSHLHGSSQRSGNQTIARAREFRGGTEAESRETVVVVDKDDNPIAAALRDLQEQVQQRNDERLTAYQKATARNHLTSCIDKVVGGKIRRATVFTATAGLKLASRRIDQSGEDDEYDVAANVAHTSYDLSSASDILNRVLSGLNSSTTATSQRPMSPTKTANAKKLNRVSSERTKAGAMSFGTFGDHVLGTADPPSSPTLKRRKSSFFQVKRKVITDDVLAEPTIVSPDPAEVQVPPPSRSNERNPNRSNSHLSAGSPFSSTRGGTPVAGAASINLLRRKRSNVASLLVNSGLGRHNVEDTRKDAAGDTNLYLRLRGHPQQPKSSGPEDTAAKSLTSKNVLGTVPDQLLSSSSNENSDEEREVQSVESDAERMWTSALPEGGRKPPAFADIPEQEPEENWSEQPPVATVSSFGSHPSASGFVAQRTGSPQQVCAVSGALELPTLPSPSLQLENRFTAACSGSQVKSALHLRRASRSFRSTPAPRSPLSVEEWYIGPQDLK